jgi:predicted ArsR family transcriptional regulator
MFRKATTCEYRALVVTDAKRRIVDVLHRADGATASELARTLELTAAAVRQHLDALTDLGLVAADDPAPGGGRGRPAQRWRLTPSARTLYPDRHADLTVELLELMRSELGEDALERIIASRARKQAEAYGDDLSRVKGVERRARRLAELRTVEGYDAEVVDAPDGDGLLLVEHHCPVCDAASTCQGLCRGELEAFRSALGDDVDVEREQHLLAGDARCTYRIRTRSRPA